MNLYATVKLVHIVSSVLLVGTGLGSAYYWFFCYRARDLAAMCVVGPLVVQADWWITTPTAIVQPLSGAWLVYLGDWHLAQQAWIVWSIALYVFATVCWLPVVWIQIQMVSIAQVAAHSGFALPPRFANLQRWWTILGAVTFVAMLAVYACMVMKPA